VLEWRVVDRHDDGAIEIGPLDQRHVTLLFEPVDEPKQGKNRVHIGLRPSSPSDQSVELDRLMDLGARRADVGQGDEKIPVRTLLPGANTDGR
jgi:Glyoxalase-like domain